jgi:enamine deaminase RidA (YjgF/YER057c/UK114 family)
MVITQGHGKTVYIGGQNAVDGDRKIIGKGNLQLQTEQIMKNIQTAVLACKATFENVVKLNIHIVDSQDACQAFQV